MKCRRRPRTLCHHRSTLAALILTVTLFACGGSSGNVTGSYRQSNLVSDVAGSAPTTDANLVNAWGIARGPLTPFWIADNGRGVSTLYDGTGKPFPTPAPLIVTIPPPAGSAPGDTAAPTGIVFNSTTDFVVTQGGNSGPASFIFATEDGTLSGWNKAVNPSAAILVADNAGSGAVYKGLTLASNASGNLLFATNFNAGAIDVFDAIFTHVSLAGSFSDSGIPAGFAPFGIQAINGSLYVTYAKQNDEKHDDVEGPGNGFVDIFDTTGKLVRRFASQGTLNSPWGLALAPANFGAFSNALLVGNFGDGRVNAFDPTTGRFLGQLADEHQDAIVIDGLWGLIFGNGNDAGDPKTLFFTAGPGHEMHGLFGSLRAVTD